MEKARVVDDVVLAGVGRVVDLASPAASGLAYMLAVLVDSQPVRAEHNTVVGLVVVEDGGRRPVFHEAAADYMAYLAALHNCIHSHLAAAD